MSDTSHIDSDALMREIARYLAAVDVFRAESCEPTWHPEPSAGDEPLVLRSEAYVKSASAAGS